jgi:hypothetical protein
VALVYRFKAPWLLYFVVIFFFFFFFCFFLFCGDGVRGRNAALQLWAGIWIL